MNRRPVLVWFDRDLRLADNPALHAAAAAGHPIVPVFFWAPEDEGPWPPGAASQWWLHQSLAALSASLAARQSALILRRGPCAQALTALAAETDAAAVFWNRRYEPAAIARDRAVESTLRARGIETHICAGNLLFEPGSVLSSTGKPFQVFTAFWRACQAMPEPPKPHHAPATLSSPRRRPSSLRLADLRLEPAVDWAAGLRETWCPGEAPARARLKAFLGAALDRYSVERDRPDRAGTSRLSPHLHFGEISARRLWHALRASPAAEPFLRQLAWREFSYHLLFHFPRTPAEPLRPDFRSFPWRMDARALKAWTRGLTGYPLVDAGMRELWRTGWMHNRVRMLAASFLVKHLLISWQEGAAWFWDTLVDADLANNTMGWQWTAGCGADAAPYFRVFNPTLQAKKFDPDGAYIRRWVPELADRSYPPAIIDHDLARRRALAALASMKQRSQ